MSSFDVSALEKLQAKWKGMRTREGEYARAKAGATILCPYLASPPSVVDAVLKLAQVKLSENSFSLFYDLGCGEGNVLVGVAKALEKIDVQSCHFVGIDIDSTLCATARRRVLEAGLQEKVEIRQQDLATITSFTSYTGKDHTVDKVILPSVIFVFLVPSCLEILSKVLFKDLPQGTYLILYKFPLPSSDGWHPVATVTVDDAVKKGAKSEVFLYIV